MDKAAYGLIGVALGFLLTVVKDWWLHRTKKQTEIEFLCIHVSCALDRFIEGCSKVVSDDGLYHGQPDQDGCSRIQVDTPNFEPKNIEVDWKSLPAKTLYEILNFPLAIESANELISSTFEHVAFPPDYSEGFEERQYQYALLGIKADNLASHLRTLAKLPEKEISEYDPLKYMEEKKNKIEEIRNKRYKAQQKMNETLLSISNN